MKERAPRCSSQRCSKPARIRGWCVSHAEQTADRLFSRWVRSRDDRCTAYGVLDGECKGILQAAHYIGRRNYSVRYDAWNVHALCAAHHYTVDQHGQEHAKQKWIQGVLRPHELEVIHDLASRITKREASISTALDWLT